MRVAIGLAHPRLLKHLRELLFRLEDVDLIWVAHRGQDILDHQRVNRPDVLLLGLDFEGVSVGELTRRLMDEAPSGILLLGHRDPQSQIKVFDALGQGASDVANLPSEALLGTDVGWEDFLNRFETLRTLLGLHDAIDSSRQLMGSDIMDIGMPVPPLVAIGASTGGPKALATVLKDLPQSFPGAVVIVQHLDHHFCQGLAEWLDQGTALSVSALNEDAVPQAGHVYVAARPEHVVLQGDRTLGFSKAEPERLNRPSVDVLFHSIARVLKSQAIGVLLTGMGRDGAEGLLAMRQAGLTTIAQDAASSVVYGMPKAARDLGAAQSILPLGTIGQELMHALECL